ncbi:alpha-(1-_3)-arabinofuranosyltransferase family protein [Knoellia sp. S7-12]|uniref:alpha-(1->3)-arabinofuranosyltransferase domain-containing protein n=1 Tax=Knoellia sp. S7-12 TaxID=3126698 RepID=UPI003365C78A
MEPDDGSAPNVRRAPPVSGLVWAGLLVVWTVAWSVTPGRVAEDTKNDLYVDPWGFLGRALHLWDPQVTWGGLQNQAFGYLFPMGPFFGLGSEVFPMWVVQRLWWMTLLTAGFVGVLGLLRALDVGTPSVRVIASLAYTLAPRVVSTIGGLSSEAQTQLLAPAILWPLVLIDQGRLGVRKGVALSGLAILCCGGVNATATAFAILPSAIWLLTRRAWWRRSTTWVWGVAVAAATSWWLVPLLIMGRHSPPFLDWIENARAVSTQVTLLDVLRGTTHWLGHLVTPGGVWWPAGHELVSSRSSIILTTVVMAVGLAGLSLGPRRHRSFLLTVLVCGVVALSLPHDGPFASPVVGAAQTALDGPLVALRNIHKADLLVRLPLAVGLAHVLGLVVAWRPRRAWLRAGALTAAVGVVIGAAAPAFGGAIATRGTFTEMAPQWRDLGAWLDTQKDSRALIVPAANFGEYSWGRTIDEPLRALTSSPYAVRDAVPLTPAGTIRLLDEVERRMQTGGSLGGATTMLRAAGIRHLVLRNDLVPSESGQPPVALARSALLNTPDVTFNRGFGQTRLDAVGTRVHPVEVFTLTGSVAPDLALWDVADVVGATGASEDLARLADAGLAGRPVIFDGDRTDGLVPASEVITDGFRARTRWFGAPRGQDVTSGLDAQAARGAPDYLPWPEVERRSVVDVTGIRDVRASSSIAEDFGFAGLQPAHRPFAALDGNPRTAWAALWDDAPELTIELERPTDLRQVTISAWADRVRFGDGLGVATDVTVTTDSGSIDAQLSTTGDPTTVALPAGSTSTVRMRIRDTTGGDTSGVVTGFSEVVMLGVAPTEVVITPSTSTTNADSAVLGAGLAGKDGCVVLTRQSTCFSGELVDPESTGPMVRDVEGLGRGERVLRGALAVDPLRPPAELMKVPGVEVTASSLRGYAPAALPVAAVDSDDRTAWSPSPSDETPSLTVTLDEPTTFTSIRMHARREWAQKESPAVVVDVDGTEVTRRLQPGGLVTIPPTVGRKLTLTFISVPGRNRPGIGSLELEELEIFGRDFAPPPQELRGACGSGPDLVVDGRQVPTSADGPRSAVFGVGEFTWKACGSVDVRDAPRHRVSLEPWRGLAPRSVFITPAEERAAVAPQNVALERASASVVEAEVDAGQRRLLVMAENSNTGWQARLGDTQLEPQVVDGWRQGFIVPEGASGRLTIDFSPDSPYRWGLLLGGLLAGALLLVAVLPDRRRRARAFESSPRATRLWSDLGIVACSGLVAGPAGLAIGVGAVGLVRFLSLRRWVWPATVVALGLVASTTQAWISPGTVGSTAVEGTVRLLVLGAIALALASSSEQATGEA